MRRAGRPAAPLTLAATVLSPRIPPVDEGLKVRRPALSPWKVDRGHGQYRPGGLAVDGEAGLRSGIVMEEKANRPPLLASRRIPSAEPPPPERRG